MLEGKKYNKMLKYLFWSMVFMYGCNGNPQPSKNIVYNWYNNTDSIIKPAIFTQYIFTKSERDSIIIKSSDSVYVSFSQTQDSTGIYRLCNNGNKVRTHSLVDTLITEFCLVKPPFVNSNVSFRDKKKYVINGKEFLLYHFIETSGNHTTYDSYYLRDVGFICYYYFDRDDYVLGDSLSGFNIDTQTMREINHKLVYDTAFFARYILGKLLPNYYRPPSEPDKF